MGNRAKTNQCTECRKVCPKCGAEKDRRSDLCKSCASSKKAKKQWAEQREKMMAGITKAQEKRRRRYEDISEDSNWQTRPDGRHFIYYWEGDKKRWIYRSRWKWQQEYGEIPGGCEIHHLDGDPSNDDLDNLECVPTGAHRQMHGTEMVSERLQRREVRGCETCGKEFMPKPRENRPGKYCSPGCYHEALRSST